ncbi:MAG: pantoate--beta-alanine ligase [Micrococcales bacterium]|nr:pantoate--beta-alanine ligase [Micrococcales bacterium]MCL2667680.1 pantoate--beta-alanine ligase [Micrococcales bacterium]
MKLVHDAPALAAALAEQDGRRAVVMTMGALHDGHLSLVTHARQRADHVVVTVFVNPLQFGAHEDLDQYPRDLPGDLAALAPVLHTDDVVYAPSVREMYPDGPPQVQVAAGPVGDVLEGAVRPGHFDGVLTVVLKLLARTRPDVAVFGAKDAQQVALVRAMVHDLDLGVSVVEAPTVREHDGLARSSRNAYLSPDDRERATGLWRALSAGREAAEAGADAPEVVVAARTVLTEAVDAVDYVSLVDARFLPLAAGAHGPARLVVAARLGTTRLIDNTELVLGPVVDRSR